MTWTRHPALLLIAVAAAIGGFWLWLGWPVQLPASPFAPEERIECVSYAPFDPGAAGGGVLTPAGIEADLRALAAHAACIRTYTTARGLDRVPEIADRIGLVVLLGAALGSDRERNRIEIETAARLARDHVGVVGAVILGSEVLSNRVLPSAELIGAIDTVRNETDIPITYADRWEHWAAIPEIAAEVDFITIHVPLYHARVPSPAGQAANAVLRAYGTVGARYPDKEIVVGEAGWPSAGPMREGARPSRVNQAIVLHEIVVAARAADFRLNLFEGRDQQWRRARAGEAAEHFGLIDRESGSRKFTWGGSLSEHPLWRFQAAIGVMAALVTFAAGFLAARSLGPDEPLKARWLPVAAIALAGGLMIGWAVGEAPVFAETWLDWTYRGALIVLALLVPPIAAAGVVRETRFEGFVAALDPLVRHALDPLTRLSAAILIVVVVVTLQAGLVLAFDPFAREFPFAVFTGPVVALAVIALVNRRGLRRGHVAEPVAAALYLVCAALILMNETVWNWQALWFAGLLLLMAWTCWRARAGRS